MTCPNCGSQLEDGLKFCNICGVRLEDIPEAEQPMIYQENVDISTPVEEPSLPDFESVQEATPFGEDVPVEEFNPESQEHNGNDIEPPRAKKSKLKFILIPVIAFFVLVLAGFVTVLASPVAKNFALKLILSPEKYMCYVIKDNAGNFADDVSQAGLFAQNSFKTNVSTTGNMKITKGEGFNELVSDAGADLAEAQLIVDAIDSVGMDVEAAVNGSRFAYNIGCDLNGTDIASFDVVMDVDTHELYMAVPELCPDYFRVDMAGEIDANSYAAYQDVMGGAEAVASVLPDEKALSKMLTAYAKCIANQIENVEESSDTYEAGGISQKMTELTMTVDEDLAEKIIVAVLEKLKDDKEIENIVKKLGETEAFKDVSSSLYRDFKDGIDNAIEAAEDIDDFEVEVTLLVNSKGEISGMLLDTDDVSVECYTVKKGKEYGVFVMMEVEKSKISIEGSGKVDGGKESAKYTIRAMGMNIMDIELKDVDTKMAEQGIFSGSMIITPSKDLSKLRYFGVPAYLSELQLTISSSAKSAQESDAAMELSYKGKMVAKIEAYGKVAESKEIQLPKNYIDINMLSEEKVSKLLENADLGKLYDGLRKAGIPSDLIDELEKITNEAKDASAAEESTDDVL